MGFSGPFVAGAAAPNVKTDPVEKAFWEVVAAVALVAVKEKGFFASSVDPKVKGFFSSDVELKSNPAFLGSVVEPKENAGFFSSTLDVPKEGKADDAGALKLDVMEFDAWKVWPEPEEDADNDANPELPVEPKDGVAATLPALDPNNVVELAGDPNVMVLFGGVVLSVEAPNEKVAVPGVAFEPKAIPLEETLLPKVNPAFGVPILLSELALESSTAALGAADFHVLVTDSSLATAFKPKVKGLDGVTADGEETRLANGEFDDILATSIVF